MADVFCNKCGHRNPSTSNFCSSCGAALDAIAEDEHPTITLTVEAQPPGEEEVEVDLGELPTGAGVLVVKRGPNTGSQFLVDKPVITAGRHPESDIFLDDITVSRRHVEIVSSDAGIVVRDVGSLNGTYVNRERIDEAPLRHGDELQIGKFKLVYVTGADRAGELA
jgi:pSer/pThr/pTyr-binding forkhead associated (FHA) protein